MLVQAVFMEKKNLCEKKQRLCQYNFMLQLKKTNETMAKVYNNLYRIKSIGLRFFTVYGPYGRPDMSYYKFSKKFSK